MFLFYLFLFTGVTVYGDYPDLIGNRHTRSICIGANQNEFCWEPKYFTGNYFDFWVSQPSLLPQSRSLSVVHIRCGDIMWKNHRLYKVSSLVCLKSHLEWLGNNITIISGGHFSGNKKESYIAKQRCDSIITLVIQTLFENSISVNNIYRDRSREEDLKTMAMSRVLSIVPSSFVFVSKLGDLENLRMLTFVEDDSPWWDNCNETYFPGEWLKKNKKKCLQNI